MRLRSCLLAVIAWSAVPFAALATDWTVRPDGTGDFPTIQAAIDAAADGDVIRLADGTFEGSGNCRISPRGKAITIRSILGNPMDCIVSPGHNNGFAIADGEGPDTVIEGITIRDATGDSCTGGGVGVYVYNASPTLRNLLVMNNNMNGIRGGTPLITGCTITQNSTYGTTGSGVALYGGTLENCLIYWNEAHGWSNAGGAGVYGSGTIRDCLIMHNRAKVRGGGIWSPGGNLTIERSTITANDSFSGTGGGISVNGSLFLSNTIVWGNCARNGGPDLYLGSGAVLSAACSDFNPDLVAGTGLILPSGNNFNVDPLFCDREPCGGWYWAGNYMLEEGSPLLDVNPCGTIGGMGAGCTTGVEPTSWGRIKARYR